MEKIEKIILYHGSISELNEEMHRRFESANAGIFFSKWYGPYVELYVSELKKELHEKGFEGLVNMKTLSRVRSFPSTGESHEYIAMAHNIRIALS